MEQIGKTRLGLDDATRKTLKSKIKLNSVGHTRSTKTKYRTDRLMNFCDDDFKYLSDKVDKVIGEHLKEKLYTVNCWGISYNQNEESKPHIHTNTSWNWVYYIDSNTSSSILKYPFDLIEVDSPDS